MNTTITLEPYVLAVLEGASVNSQALAADVNPTVLRRLVHTHPGYAAAVAAGKIAKKPRLNAEQLRSEPHVLDVVQGGKSMLDSAVAHDLSEMTVRKHVKLAYPDFGFAKASTNPHANTEPVRPVRSVPIIDWEEASAWSADSDTAHVLDWGFSMAPCSPGSFMLRVSGDSMTAPNGQLKSYPEGCLIVVDPAKREPQNGERVLAYVGQRTNNPTFKIYKNEDNAQWLAPLNPMHRPILEKFTVLGTIVGKWED